MKCINCGKECGKNSCGFHTSEGFICGRCENAEIAVYTITSRDFPPYVAKDETNVIEFVSAELDNIECGGKTTLSISYKKMSVIKYYNLPEWEG